MWLDQKFVYRLHTVLALHSYLGSLNPSNAVYPFHHTAIVGTIEGKFVKILGAIGITLRLHEATGKYCIHQVYRLPLAPPGSSWLPLVLPAPPGFSWPPLTPPGSSWLPLAPPGSCWLLLASPGSSWLAWLLWAQGQAQRRRPRPRPRLGSRSRRRPRRRFNLQKRVSKQFFNLINSVLI